MGVAYRDLASMFDFTFSSFFYGDKEGFTEWYSSICEFTACLISSWIILLLYLLRGDLVTVLLSLLATRISVFQSHLNWSTLDSAAWSLKVLNTLGISSRDWRLLVLSSMEPGRRLLSLCVYMVAGVVMQPRDSTCLVALTTTGLSLAPLLGAVFATWILCCSRVGFRES